MTTLSRKQKTTLLTAALLLSFILISAQAGNHNHAFFWNLKRLVPKRLLRNDSSLRDDNEVCVNNYDDVYLLYSRGGYREDVATEEAEVTTLTPGHKKHVRLDTEAKAKEYGELEFSLFQKGDGSDEDPDGIPTRYLKMQLHRREHAKTALQATLHWRQEHDIDTILARPHPDYDVCKAIFPHYFVGRDKDHHVVFVQRPSLLDLDLAHANHVDNEALLSHYVYVNEYLWQVIEADNALATMTSILDLQGLNLGLLRQPDLIHFMKQFVKTMDAHFPQRSQRMIIVNAPKWFNVLFKIVSPLLRETTKAKIEIHANGKRQDKALHAKLGDGAEKLLPETFFSKSKKKKHKKKKNKKADENNNDSDEDELPPPDHHELSDLEKGLRDFTLAQLAAAHVNMQPVVPA